MGYFIRYDESTWIVLGYSSCIAHYIHYVLHHPLHRYVLQNRKCTSAGFCLILILTPMVLSITMTLTIHVLYRYSIIKTLNVLPLASHSLSLLPRMFSSCYSIFPTLASNYSFHMKIFHLNSGLFTFLYCFFLDLYLFFFFVYADMISSGRLNLLTLTPTKQAHHRTSISLQM